MEFQKKTLIFFKKVLVDKKELLPLPPRKRESGYRNRKIEAKGSVAKNSNGQHLEHKGADFL